MTLLKGIMNYLFIAILALSGTAHTKELTRDDLLKGSKIPEKREFPLSKEYGACEDFHKHVCSEIETSFKLPADRNRWYFSFSDNSERILQARKNFFKKVSEGYTPKGERIGQVQNFYLSCMNVSASKKSERAYVVRKKSEIESLKTNKDFQRYVSSGLIHSEFVGVVGIDEANQKDPNVKDILLLTDVSTFPVASYYSDQKALGDLKNLAKELFKNLNLKDAEKRAQDVVNLEILINKNMPLPAEMRALLASNTYKTREFFIKTYPNINWEPLFAKIPPKTMIRNLTEKSLGDYNKTLGEASPAALQNVFLFHSLKPVMQDAYPKFFKAYLGFQHKYSGSPEQLPPRDERCTNQMASLFSFEIDEYLMPILFPSFPRQQVVDLATQVRNAILKKIDENKWLSAGARKEAKKKMSEAPLNLVAPTTFEDWNFNKVQNYSKEDRVSNINKFNSAKMEKMFAELSQKRNRNQWAYSPLVLNAYYTPPDNRFFLLQGILQPPFFDPQGSPLENYGAIGSVIGHELGHGIDDNGSRYDSQGRLNQWMTMDDLVEFKKRGDQFIKRFDSVGHNGRLTLGENIGDHVGINASYSAYFDARPESTIEDKQKFFRAYARLWCNVTSKEANDSQLKTDPHSLGRERINQQVIHVDGFYQAYSCKEGDKMYVAPKDRIRVW